MIVRTPVSAFHPSSPSCRHHRPSFSLLLACCSILLLSRVASSSSSSPSADNRRFTRRDNSHVSRWPPNLRCGDIIDDDEFAGVHVDEEDPSPSSANTFEEKDPPSIAKEESEFESELCALASARRSEAKLLHDAGKWREASLAFREAALLLREASSEAVTEECATCRLHEALCLLKDGDAEGCAEVCTQVLGEDGANVPAASVDGRVLPSRVRARAHLRRAKARLALDDFDGALEDAKQSAFMGDRNAVAFYGRLMREGKNAAAAGADHDNSLGSSHWGDAMREASQNSFLQSMLKGIGGNNNPFVPSDRSGSADFSSSLLRSLLCNDNGGGTSDGGPMGILGELLAPSQPETALGKFPRRRNKKKKKNGIDTLAKSLLSNVMKRMENEETQETICRYLHLANTQQIMQNAALAGVPMKEESAQRLVRLASGITPRGIRRSITHVKRGLKVVRTLRKVLKVIDKYKSIIVWMMLFLWIKSAILEPYPVDKRQVKKLA